MASRRTDKNYADWRQEWREWDQQNRRNRNRDVAAGYFICALALLILALAVYYFSGQLFGALIALEVMP